MCVTEAAFSYQNRRIYDVGRDMLPYPVPAFASKNNPYRAVFWSPSALQQYYLGIGYDYVSNPRAGASRGYEVQIGSGKPIFVPVFKEEIVYNDRPRPLKTAEMVRAEFDPIQPTRDNFSRFSELKENQKKYAQYEIKAIEELANAYQSCLIERGKEAGIEIKERKAVGGWASLIGGAASSTANPIGLAVGIVGTVIAVFSTGKAVAKEFQEYAAGINEKLNELRVYHDFYKEKAGNNSTFLVVGAGVLVASLAYKKWKQQ